MDQQALIDFLEFSNEILSIAIVIISVSMLLYNLTRNYRDRVNRASSVLLASVSIAYLADVFVALEPNQQALENSFRFQWIGVAFVPAAMYHLSDALLATTGLVSRGRRRKAVRALYGVATALSAAALMSDSLVRALVREPVWHMNAGPIFAVYLAYFLVAGGFAFFNVIRAWRRCLTTYTRRRMTYLMAAFITPAWGIFPYSLLLSSLSSGLNAIPEFVLWTVFNIANLAVLAMLAFMAYPLSFFGAQKPDRLVKAELLQFMVRGPLTGVVVVAVIQTFTRLRPTLGVGSDEFIAFATVGAVLCLQWGITVFMPRIENWLVYTQDQQQARLFKEFSQRLFTRADANQLQEAILAAVCDQLRVPTAFIASIRKDEAHLEQYVGFISSEELQAAEKELIGRFDGTATVDDFETDKVKRHGRFFLWRSFWLVPVHRRNGLNSPSPLLGLLGIWARSPEPALSEEEEHILDVLVERTSEVLTNIYLQGQIFSMIEGLIPETPVRADSTNISPFGQVSVTGDTNAQPDLIKSRRSIIASEDFPEMVRDALRDYWGGSKLLESELLNLGVVDEEAAKMDGNRVNALRRVLDGAIERLRPEGQQNFTRTDWILYNILEMRFLQGRKVRDVARRLTMSQSDFYRKQRAAIEEVARIIGEFEQQYIAETQASSDLAPHSEPDHVMS
ncbi:MAG: hypothetical protein GYB66_03660 [Chloroflexi bacterium]|nr:hypothetical protein [Chloroflexota bacterium]